MRRLDENSHLMAVLSGSPVLKSVWRYNYR